MSKRVPLILLIVAALAAAIFFLRRPKPNPSTVSNPPRPAPASSRGANPPASAGGGDVTSPAAFDDDPPGTLRLEGQVIDAEKKPVAGATVSVSTNPRRTTRTEGDGSFAFDRLVARGYTLAAVAGDGFAGPVTVRLAAKSEPVILRLGPAGAIEVTVVAAADRKPVAGASVELRDAPITPVATDAAGKATLHGVSGGGHFVAVTAAQFAPGGNLVFASGRPGAVQKQVVELRRGAAVAGTVVDDAGKPVAGARVRAAPAGGLFDPARRGEPAISDAAGRWSMAALPAGTFRFSASDDKHAPGASAPVTLDGATARDGIVITVAAGASVAGKVVARNGDPVAGATVRVVGQGPPRQVVSDDKGAFAMGGLPRAPAQLVASSDTAASPIVELDLDVRPERTDLVVTLDIDGQIAGVVVDGKGNPAPGAQVSAFPRGGGPGGGGPGGGGRGAMRARGLNQDVADESGHFALHGLPPGTYRVMASRAGSTAAPFGGFAFGGPGGRGGRGGGPPPGTTAEVGDLDVHLVLPDQGRVRGKVLYADGTPPPSFSVSTGGGPGASFSAPDGAFELDAATGSASLSVSGPQFQPKSVPEVNVPVDDVVDVGTVTVDKGRRITGRVLSATGTPVAGAKVLAGTQLLGGGDDIGGGLRGGAGTQTVSSDDDGSYTIGGAAGRTLLLAADHETQGRSQVMRIPGGDGDVSLDLQLQSPGSLEGRVTSGGQPLRGALVTASPQKAALGNFAVRAGDDGTFRFDRLAPDTYYVSGRDGGPGRGTEQSATVVVTAGQTANVALDIPAGTVTVDVTTPRPAEVVLVSGAIQAANGEQLADAVAARGAGASHMNFAFPGRPAELDNVAPGPYSACAVAFPADVQSPRDLGGIRDKISLLPCICQPVTVAASPAEQQLSLKM